MEQADHILVVDDDRDIREMIAAYLRKNGLRASVVANGREMRAVLDVSPIDLIVLDVIMPGDDGLMLCRTLRAGN
jgi:two-component system, OmpR family, response regulator